MQVKRKIRVFQVDGSASSRACFKELLDSDPELELLGAAIDGIFARRKLEKEWPDVFLLDVDLPRMDGIRFLREIMAKQPTPVLIFTSDTEASINRSMDALKAGAVQVICKPKSALKEFFKNEADHLVHSIKSAARANLRNLPAPKKAVAGNDTVFSGQNKKLSADVILPPLSVRAITTVTQRIVAIGASMGGTRALELVLSRLPMLSPGILIVQHIPNGFSKAFADRLNSVCRMEVREAQDGDMVIPGVALLSPGNRHMLVKRVRREYSVALNDGPPVSRHRPSVDVLFRSVAQSAGFNALGIILTGMGDDGAQGMLELHQSGASTIAQDKESCVVFGMPNEAVKRRAVDKVVTLSKVPAEILAFAEEHGSG